MHVHCHDDAPPVTVRLPTVTSVTLRGYPDHSYQSRSLCAALPEPPAGRLWGGGIRWFVEATLVPTVPSPDFQEDPEATAQPFCLLVPTLSHMNAAN